MLWIGGCGKTLTIRVSAATVVLLGRVDIVCLCFVGAGFKPAPTLRSFFSTFVDRASSGGDLLDDQLG